MQQDRSAAIPDMRAERLNQLARRGAAIFKQIPPTVWRVLAAFLLVLWLSHSLARLFWLLVPEPDVPQAQVAANALVSDQSGGVSRQVDIAELKQVEVFGRVDESAVADEEPDTPTGGPGIEDEAVDTQLNLSLQGVIDSSEETGGRAIIASGSDQDIYAPGDELPEGRNVTLEKVLPLRVILNNDGRYESLWLYQEGDFSAARARQNGQSVEDTPSRSWEGDESELTEGPDGALNDEADAEQAQGPEPEEETDAAEAVDRVSRNLSDVVSMSIHRENGQIVGYKIRPGRDRALFESLGLEAGDVVKAVNGTELSSPQKVMELYRNMGDASSASLLIERDGQELSVDIELE